MSWEKVHTENQLWRGRGTDDPKGMVEGGLVWLDGFPYIVKRSAVAGVMLYAIKPGTLERKVAE